MEQLARTSTSWVNTLLGGAIPTCVQAVPAHFRDPLRKYLQYLKTERKRAPRTDAA